MDGLDHQRTQEVTTMPFISYAINHEDVLLWRALKSVSPGFYIDIHPDDPVENSVTYAFYEHNWNGINVQPVYENYDRLVVSRPRDLNLLMDAGTAEKNINIAKMAKEKSLASPLQEAAPESPADPQKNGITGSDLSLNQILEEKISGPVHFLRINGKGAEEAILQSLNLSSWRPWILLVTFTTAYSAIPEIEIWEKQILEAGYHFVYFDGLNKFFIANERAEIDHMFQLPPNHLDDYVTIKELRSDEAAQKLYTANLRISELAAELNQARTKIYNQNVEINNIHSRLELLHLSQKKISAELDKVYASRSYKMTGPLRFVFGKLRILRGRITWLYSVSIEPILHKGIIYLRQVSFIASIKRVLKGRLPGLWRLLRGILLPSFETTKVYMKSNVFRSALIQKSQEYLDDEKYFKDLFQREVSARKGSINEVKP